MLAHGVPANQTAWLQERLGIQGLADLAGLSIWYVVLVPRALRPAFIHLRHAHCPPDAVWQTFTAPDLDWEAFNWDAYEDFTLLQLAEFAIQTEMQTSSLVNVVLAFSAASNASDAEDSDAADSDAEDSDAEDSDVSTSTASTAEMPIVVDEPSDADNGAEDDEVAYE